MASLKLWFMLTNHLNPINFEAAPPPHADILLAGPKIVVYTILDQILVLIHAFGILSPKKCVISRINNKFILKKCLSKIITQ